MTIHAIGGGSEALTALATRARAMVLYAPPSSPNRRIARYAPTSTRRCRSADTSHGNRRSHTRTLFFMHSNRRLALLSSAQLVCGVAGYLLAVDRGHPYDILWMQGREDKIVRDSVLMGTALSAPVTMLLLQGALTGVIVSQPHRRAERILGALGATMVAGYLGERHVRLRLTPAGWDSLESPLVAAGVALAAGMAAVGFARPTAGLW